MKEFIKQNNIENGNEREQEYLSLVDDYFSGIKNINYLSEKVENIVDISISDEKNILPTIKDPVIFISNHPRPDRSICIPASKIQNKKGGNVFGFDNFHYPLVNQIMLKRLLKRPFSTIALDVGWREAMEECGHIIITNGGEDRTNEIMEKYTHGQSIVIYPEGKSSGNVEVFTFHTGFLRLAKNLGFSKIVLGVSSPLISLNDKNSLDVIGSIETPPSNVDLCKFAENIRNYIEKELRKKYKN